MWGSKKWKNPSQGSRNTKEGLCLLDVVHSPVSPRSRGVELPGRHTQDIMRMMEVEVVLRGAAHFDADREKSQFRSIDSQGKTNTVVNSRSKKKLETEIESYLMHHLAYLGVYL